MEYYYDPSTKSNVTNTNGKYITSKLKSDTSSDADDVITKIGTTVKRITHSKRDLKKHWNGVTTFGWIFVDYNIPDGAYWNAIRAGYLDLFRIIHDKFYCLVLSDSMAFNMRDVEIKGHRVLIININYFKKFAKAITRKNFVNLFMYDFPDPEIEKIIRGWLIEKPDKLQLIMNANEVSISDVSTLIEKYQINTLDDLSNLLDNASNFLQSRIEQNYKLFDERLIEFETLIHEEKKENEPGKKSNLENKLKDHLKKNPWIIDFTYNEKDVDVTTHPYVDVLVVGSYLGFKKGLIIELKRPDVDIVKKYRDRAAITATIGNAISQLIQYTKEIHEKSTEENITAPEENNPALEENTPIIKESKSIFYEGLIVIGNDMDEFIPYFNTFLHNISVKTFQEIHDDARKRLDTFADGPSNPVDEQPPSIQSEPSTST
ncbi:MAG: Shedu anti-phage system protein SduA domain-containing protein [Candidatus Nitrosopumilus sp. bin_7KS]